MSLATKYNLKSGHSALHDLVLCTAPMEEAVIKTVEDRFEGLEGRLKALEENLRTQERRMANIEK